MTIFLDHNSTTPLLPKAFEAMKPYFEELFFNPSGIHGACESIGEQIESWRFSISRHISSKKGRLIFTASATEANNFVLKQEMFKSVVTIAIEHPSVIVPALHCHPNRVYLVKVDEAGLIDLDDLENKIKLAKMNGRTLVSIQYANSVIHTIQPVSSISKICREMDVNFHIDATQAFGRICMPNIDVDFITVSAHKCYGPKGIGGLWISERILSERLVPLIHGGHQENSMRAGTYNVPSILGFKIAADYMYDNIENHTLYLNSLVSKFWNEFTEVLPDASMNGDVNNRIPGGLSISVKGTDIRSIILGLPDIIISSGMSCSSKESDPVLKAIGREDLVRCTFRMQIGFENTENEIDIAAKKISGLIKQSRNFWGYV